LILLDTNVVSELVRSRPFPQVQAWFARQEPASLYLSAITLGEIEIGARSHPDPTRRARLLDWCAGLQNNIFLDRILPFDADAARIWGQIVVAGRQRKRTIEWRDSQIAATATRFETRLATRNIRHFADLGLDLVDPFANEG